ncbi:MAG: outer membrane beta-barrel protein [Nitrospirae bacterium]|nr:outer membrane beta-barrel protein [Nitrospirota bacterium]
MKIKIIFLFVVFALLTGSTAVMAEEPVDTRWYIAPGVNYIFADNDRNADNDAGFRLGIGKAISREWSAELDILIDNLSISGKSNDFRQRGLSLNALYFFTQHAQLSPYGVLGIGALRTTVPGTRSTNLMAELGLGLSYSTANTGAT